MPPHNSFYFYHCLTADLCYGVFVFVLLFAIISGQCSELHFFFLNFQSSVGLNDNHEIVYISNSKWAFWYSDAYTTSWCIIGSSYAYWDPSTGTPVYLFLKFISFLVDQRGGTVSCNSSSSTRGQFIKGLPHILTAPYILLVDDDVCLDDTGLTNIGMVMMTRMMMMTMMVIMSGGGGITQFNQSRQ